MEDDREPLENRLSECMITVGDALHIRKALVALQAILAMNSGLMIRNPLERMHQGGYKKEVLEIVLVSLPMGPCAGYNG